MDLLRIPRFYLKKVFAKSIKKYENNYNNVIKSNNFKNKQELKEEDDLLIATFHKTYKDKRIFISENSFVLYITDKDENLLFLFNLNKDLTLTGNLYLLCNLSFLVDVIINFKTNNNIISDLDDETILFFMDCAKINKNIIANVYSEELKRTKEELKQKEEQLINNAISSNMEDEKLMIFKKEVKKIYFN